MMRHDTWAMMMRHDTWAMMIRRDTWAMMMRHGTWTMCFFSIMNSLYYNIYIYIYNSTSDLPTYIQYIDQSITVTKTLVHAFSRKVCRLKKVIAPELSEHASALCWHIYSGANYVELYQFHALLISNVI